jgi:immune inhibitor A
MLCLALSISLIAVHSPRAHAMPPHPELIKQIKSGEMPTPYFLANHNALMKKGVNKPSAAIAEAAAFGLSAPALGPSGDFKALALLVDFSDNVSQVTATYFDTLVFGAGPNSVRDYYDEVSYGSLTIVTVHLPSSIGWLRAPQEYTYYTNNANGFGAYPQNAQKLVEDIVDAADAVVDFSQYDGDSDGYVDALFVIHAGPGAEYTGNDNHIWSHKWGINPRLKDGVYISTYSMEPEYWVNPGDMTIGVYAHELGHVLGLPDLYDYGYDSEGAGAWSLMAGGSWNGPWPGGGLPSHLDAWSRAQLGFADPVILTENTPELSINAVEAAPEIYYLWDCGAPSQEYFLIENRQRVGYDAGLPSAGLLIWHIDGSKWDNDSQCLNQQNCLCPTNYLVALEQADGLMQLEYNLGRGDGGDPYPGSSNNRTFNLGSTPNSGSYADCTSTVAVTNIGNSGATMTADVAVCEVVSELSQINLTGPGNQSIIYLAPTFTWNSDGGQDSVYAVDLSIPQIVPLWSTHTNLHILIEQNSWTIPNSLWNQIPSGSKVYWRVRGVESTQPPLNIITSDEVWSFNKL